MTTPVRQRDRVAILNALRAGVVPGRGLEHLQVGRAAEVQALVGDIKHIRERGTAVRFVVGEYGSGKSFFLQVIRHAAQRAGCVTMGADLAQDAPLYGTGGRVMSLYSSLISSTGTKSQPDGGAMGEVLERFCSECHDRARRERRDAEAVLHNRLAPLKGFRGGYEFADVVVTYWRAARHGDETRREAVLRWLSGQYRTKGEARAAIGVNGVIGDSDLYPTLRLLAMFIREAGYAGLLVELDELAVLARLNKPTRDQNYEQILTMVKDLLAGRAEGLGILFAGTPEFANDPTRGLASYGALRQRLSPNEFVRPGMHDTAGPVINLASLTPEDLYVLLENVHRVYCSNGHRDPLSSPRALEAFLDHCSAQLGGLAKVTPREATRSFLHFLDILDQNRDQRWESVLDHVEVSIDEDVLLSQHRVDAEFASLIGTSSPGEDDLTNFALG